jgi:hypothetical protein
MDCKSPLSAALIDSMSFVIIVFVFYISIAKIMQIVFELRTIKKRATGFLGLLPAGVHGDNMNG